MRDQCDLTSSPAKFLFLTRRDLRCWSRRYLYLRGPKHAKSQRESQRLLERDGRDEQKTQRAAKTKTNESRPCQLSLSSSLEWVDSQERERWAVDSLLNQNHQTPSHRIPPPNRIQLPFLSHPFPTSPPSPHPSSSSRRPHHPPSRLSTSIRQPFQAQEPPQRRTVPPRDLLQCPTSEGRKSGSDESSARETGEGVAGEVESFVCEGWRRCWCGRRGTGVFCFGEKEREVRRWERKEERKGRRKRTNQSRCSISRRRSDRLLRG